VICKAFFSGKWVDARGLRCHETLDDYEKSCIRYFSYRKKVWKRPWIKAPRKWGSPHRRKEAAKKRKRHEHKSRPWPLHAHTKDDIMKAKSFFNHRNLAFGNPLISFS
jgi:hypothetical protein